MDWYRHEQALYNVAKPLLRLFNNMPCPKILINPRMEYAAWAYGYERIEFQISYVLNATFEQIEGTMKHELVHIWMSYNRMDDNDSCNHGPIFQKKAKEVGATLYGRSYPGIHYRIP